jgi:hypothetical protein
MMKLTLKQVQAYGEGLMRWMESGEISMGDMREGKKAYNVLSCLIANPRRDVIDSNFNGMSFEELCRYLDVTNPDNELRNG